VNWGREGRGVLPEVDLSLAMMICPGLSMVTRERQASSQAGFRTGAQLG